MIVNLRTLPGDLAKLIAVVRGQIWFEGNPCRHGHGVRRYVSTGDCVKCQNLWDKAYRAKKPRRKARA